MVILIGGESHTGKTLMAQKLLEKHLYPYTCIDHLKMGIYRGCKDCGFTPLDSEDVISESLWGIIEGIADTCCENEQNRIIEGCYLPPERVCKFKDRKDITAVYIIFSRSYIENNFLDIISHENEIEKRKYSEEHNIADFIKANLALKERCADAGITYFEIQSDYEKEIEKVYEYIDDKLANI